MLEHCGSKWMSNCQKVHHVHIGHRRRKGVTGDLICTGSPAGLENHHGSYLSPGDPVEAEVEGLHCQRTFIASLP
jgi:hypothetical protein